MRECGFLGGRKAEKAATLVGLGVPNWDLESSHSAQLRLKFELRKDTKGLWVMLREEKGR